LKKSPKGREKNERKINTSFTQKLTKTKHANLYNSRLFNEKFGELLEVYSGGYDVMTKDVFNKIWSGKGLHDLLAKAVESDGMTTKSVLKLLIEVTNPR
jgi:hypothetical protein